MNTEKDNKRGGEGKHTPGPWYVENPNSEHPSRAMVAARRGQVSIYDAPLTVETLANARLIAAAPDLLEALEALLTHSEVTYTAPTCERGALATQCEFEADVTIQQARAAIAKAKGQ